MRVPVLVRTSAACASCEPGHHAANHPFATVAATWVPSLSTSVTSVTAAPTRPSLKLSVELGAADGPTIAALSILWTPSSATVPSSEAPWNDTTGGWPVGASSDGPVTHTPPDAPPYRSNVYGPRVSLSTGAFEDDGETLCWHSLMALCTCSLAGVVGVA